MVGVIDFPNNFSGLALVLRRFHRRSEQHGTKDAGPSPRPPFGHLINGLARVALNDGNLVDGDDGKIYFKTGLGPVRVGEVHRLNGHLAPSPHRSGDLLSEKFLLGFA